MAGENDLSRRAWLGAATAGASMVILPVTGADAATGTHASTHVRLNLNENAFGPSPKVGQAILAHVQGIERYVEQTEVDALIAQIAAHERVRADQVVIGEMLEPLGLYLATQYGGGEIVYSTPGYTALVDSGAPLGASGTAVPLNARLENDLPALARAIGDRTIAVNLVNPHNPSGTVNERAELDAFIRRVARLALVVVDEAYLEYDDLQGRSAVRHVREDANVLVFRTLAKIYGLAGLSIGYALAPTPLADGLRKMGIGGPHSLNRLAIVAATAALTDQGHVRWVRETILSERARVTAVLDRLGLGHSDSRANFIFFRSERVADFRARFAAAGISIGRPFPPLDEWVRITIGTPPENDAVIRVLESFKG